MVVEALEEEGHVVDETAAGAGGLTRLQQAAYDLVIAELYLPEITGLEFAAALRSIGPTAPPLIIVTALGDWGTYARALELGVTAFHTKTLGMQELSYHVARALSGRRSLRARGVPAREEAA